jgi:hypothetical protein
MQAKGQYDAEKYKKVSEMLDKMSGNQLAVLIEYYKTRKEQVEQHNAAMRESAQTLAMGQAEINLRRLEAYRDSLKQEVERRMQIHEQEVAITQQQSAIAGAMWLDRLQNFPSGGWGAWGGGCRGGGGSCHHRRW